MNIVIRLCAENQIIRYALIRGPIYFNRKPDRVISLQKSYDAITMISKTGFIQVVLLVVVRLQSDFRACSFNMKIKALGARIAQVNSCILRELKGIEAIDQKVILH